MPHCNERQLCCQHVWFSLKFDIAGELGLKRQRLEDMADPLAVAIF
jgi:hypothetical protein